MMKVSIIIPVYNTEGYLAECLESVVIQTLKEIEIICIDDCSTDHSINILNKYAAMDSRIVILHNSKTYGPSYSRNRGLKFARGEYVYFLDSDDMITPRAMEELYITSKQQKLDVVFFDATLIFENEQLKERYITYQSERKNEYKGIFTGKDLFIDFINNREWVVSPPRQFWRRNYLLNNNLGFYEGIIHEDELFTFLALLRAKRALCLKNKYFIRRFRKDSIITSDISEKNIKGLFTCYQEMLSFWNNTHFNEPVNKAIDVYLSRFLDHIKHKYKIMYNKGLIDHLSLENTITNHLFKQIVFNDSKTQICKKIDSNKLSIIKKYNKVIIYGAGEVARELLVFLDRCEIAIHGFAVSHTIGNPKSIMGNSVYNIEELTEFCKDTIVLVAVMPRYQESILRKLDDLGFKNVMVMVVVEK